MTEEERVLRMAQDEVRQLRQRNEILSAKVDMIELFATVLYTKPHYQSVGMSEDVVWLIDKVLDANRKASEEVKS